MQIKHFRVVNRARNYFATKLLVKSYRATQRLPISFEAAKKARVLVIAPHYDDEVIGAGGTLLQMRDLMSTLGIVFVSNGASGARDAKIAANISMVRREEAKLATSELQAIFSTCYEFPDGQLTLCEEEVSRCIARDIQAFQPTMILSPFPFDGHPDHQACAIALAGALKSIRWTGTVQCYEVWSALWPNLAIDISPVIDQKIRLIEIYQSQLHDRNYVAAVVGLNQFRGLPHRVDYAEAFYRASSEVFQGLVKQLQGP